MGRDDAVVMDLHRRENREHEEDGPSGDYSRFGEARRDAQLQGKANEKHHSASPSSRLIASRSVVRG
jgi:hypothetical protein